MHGALYIYIRHIVVLIHVALAWRGITKPLDWQDLILEAASGKNPRVENGTEPQWESHGGIRKGENRRGVGEQAKTLSFAVRTSVNVRCVTSAEGLSEHRKSVSESTERNK